MANLRQLVTLAWLAVTTACGPSQRKPSLEGIEDQTAHVGEMFSLELRGSDPEGAPLTFEYRAPSLPDLGSRAELIPVDDTTARFTWRPVATDVGTWAIDFEVSDGFQTTSQTVSVTVVAAPSEKQRPVFVKPAQSSGTFDLAQAPCLDVALEVEDDDSASVSFAEEGTAIAGGELTVTGPFTATWHWCPTHEQAGNDRFTLQVAASDEEEETAHLVYRIFLRQVEPGGLGACESCTADSQCGGAADNCIAVGEGGPRCGTACDGDEDCPESHECPTAPVASVDGASARQCVPRNRDCESPGPVSCVEDDAEPDDGPDTATVAPIQSTDRFVRDGTICADDSDYYWVYLGDNDTLRASLAFDQASPEEDLDLWIWDEQFQTLTGSATTHPNEYFEFTPGTEGAFYVEIAGWQGAENAYRLCLSRRAGQCPVF